VFLRPDGRRLDRHGAGRVVRRTARRAGIGKRAGRHTLRHAFITAVLDAGVPLRDVQDAASHADPRTTMRYDNSRELHQMGEKPQVTRSRQRRIAFWASEQRPLDQACLQNHPS
jgi:site-specific recombinase XerD